MGSQAEDRGYYKDYISVVKKPKVGKKGGKKVAGKKKQQEQLYRGQQGKR
jgi:hypothetical protein